MAAGLPSIAATNVYMNLNVHGRGRYRTYHITVSIIRIAPTARRPAVAFAHSAYEYRNSTLAIK